MYVLHMYAWCLCKPEEGLGSLDLQLETSVNYIVDARRAFLMVKPSLQLHSVYVCLQVFLVNYVLKLGSIYFWRLHCVKRFSSRFSKLFCNLFLLFCIMFCLHICAPCKCLFQWKLEDDTTSPRTRARSAVSYLVWVLVNDPVALEK